MLTMPKKQGKEEQGKAIVREKGKVKVLVMEDREELRELLSDILKINGYEVMSVSDGGQGIEIFKKEDFDLVLTDLMMPGMSGLQVAEEIKRIKGNSPIALITGSVEFLKTSELKKSGIDFVLNKPFRIDQLLRLVSEMLRLSIF